MSTKYAYGFARLNQKGLVCFEILESFYNRIVGFPATSRSSGSTVDNEIFWLFCDFWIEVVHKHAQRSLGLPAFSRQLAPTWSVNLPRRVVTCKVVLHSFVHAFLRN